MNNKNSELILCSGMKMDRNYENVLSYSESDMVSLCRTNKIYEANKYTFLGNNNYIEIECPYDTAMYANYVAFINPNFGNKWIFAWVTDVKLLSPKATRIYFEIDVWSTWYGSFEIGKAFIEREHVSDDTVGKHTIPEGLETGEYTCSSITSLYTGGNTTYICIACTKVPSEISVDSYHTEYNGVYSGTINLLFNDTLSASKFLKIMDSLDMGDAVMCVYLVPTALTGTITFNTVTITDGDGNPRTIETALLPYTTTYTTLNTVNSITKPSTLNGYTPKNGKMWVWPYNYFYVSNNVGSDVEFHYEDFISNTASFKTIGSITPGCSIKCVPLNYKSISDTTTLNSYNYGIVGAKYPICSWQSDVYTNWLTQNGVNLGLSIAGSVGGIGVGIGMLASGVGAIAGIGAIAGGVMGIAKTVSQIYEHSLVPPQAKGNQNSGDITFSASKMDIPLFKMTIKYEMAVVIDSYFSRFGYKVNEVKTPNLTSRTNFNFIKVGGMDELITGNIPASDLEKINEVLRKGVTIFHNYTNFGDYTVTNTIVS